MALNNVPLAGQTLLATRDLIAQNFTNINNGFAANHVELGIANAGKHKAVHFLSQANAPAAPVTGAGEMSLYAAPSLYPAVATAMYLKVANSPANVNGIDFTTFGDAQNGWCRLPCGLKMRWGTVTSNPVIAFNVAQIHVYPVGANEQVFENEVYSVQITTKATGLTGPGYNTFAQPLDWTTSLLQFTYLASERTNSATRQTTFTYLALGT